MYTKNLQCILKSTHQNIYLTKHVNHVLRKCSTCEFFMIYTKNTTCIEKVDIYWVKEKGKENKRRKLKKPIKQNIKKRKKQLKTKKSYEICKEKHGKGKGEQWKS